MPGKGQGPMTCGGGRVAASLRLCGSAARAQCCQLPTAFGPPTPVFLELKRLDERALPAIRMRPLLLHLHASRTLAAHAAPVAPPSRSIASFIRQTPPTCARSALQDECRARWRAASPASWPRRHFSASARWTQEGNNKKPLGSSDPIPMPPPPPQPSSPPAAPPSSGLNFDDIPEHLIPPHLRPVKTPEPPKEEPKPVEESKQPVEPETTDPETTTSNESPPEHDKPRPQNTNASSTSQDKLKSNVTPVPNEHLPSHHQGQRWDLSKRLQELMDEVLPKLAVVTQKVNTYTGTDYSGVAALRSEIKEHGKFIRLLHITQL
jgi:sensitive to high expression protein 9